MFSFGGYIIETQTCFISLSNKDEMNSLTISFGRGRWGEECKSNFQMQSLRGLFLLLEVVVKLKERF